MAAVLPVLFLLLAIAYFAVLDEWRVAFVKGAIAWGVAVVVNTEVLSLFQGVRPIPLAVVWTLEGVLVQVLVWRRRDALSARLGAAQGWRVIAAVSPLLVIAAATAVIAVVAPPNTFDAMTYHMARVAHWAADGTVAFYPTSTLRQLFLNPWSEYGVLQLQVLSGGDRLANLVQWFCMAGSIVVASLIAKQLHAPLRGQLLAAFAVGTLPMGILQSTSTQNDYSAGLWLLCAVAATLAYVAAPSLQGAFWIGASVGLALLTKGSSYIFVAPLALLLAGWMVVRLKTRLLVPAAVMIAVPLALNAGMYLRNEAQFQSPLGPGQETAILTNATFEPAAIGSNVLRDSALQVGTPFGNVNHMVERAIVRFHKLVLHIDASDPRTTFEDSKFAVNPLSLDEDYAGDPLQSVLALVAVVAALMLWRRTPLLAIYAAALAVAFILFAGYLKWQPWLSRLELPLLLVAGPLIGTVLARWWKPFGVAAVAALLVAGAVPFVIDNQSRPVVGFAFPLNPRLLAEGATIFNTPRDDLYFVKNPTFEAPVRRVAADAQSAGCREIGMWLRGNDWEYPLWALAGPGTRFDQAILANASETATRFGSRPCLLVTTIDAPAPTIELDRVFFVESWAENGVAFYTTVP
jgi:hypothetical protein